ncbi:cysteine desulfurase family protein [Candidatus Omnitrophota bacterium]
MEKKHIYLDHNATTPLHPQVKKAISAAMEEFGNPSSLHDFGRRAKQMVEEARERVASFIGASPEEIIFVGSGSEANNAVLNVLQCDSTKCGHKCGGADVITTKIEHPCIMETSKCLTDRGINVSYLDVDRYGKLKLDQLKEMPMKKSSLVSVMMANNEIGTTQDIKKISAIVHERGGLFHTDAVQGVGKIPVDVKDLGIDFLSLSGHKIYGPKGIGALYVKKGTPFCPFIRGGHQERGRRAGTENTIGITGLGKAIEMRAKEMKAEEKRLLKLKAALREGIEENIPDIRFNGHPTDCLAGTLNVSFRGAEGEAILLYLDLEGIAVSTGSACASGSLDPSHVLLATGLPAEEAHGSIRMSLGRDNTIVDVKYTVKALAKVMKRLRGMSSAYVEKAK